MNTRLRKSWSFWATIIGGLIWCICASSPAYTKALALDITELEHQTVRAPAEFLQDHNSRGIEELEGALFEPLTDREINRGISGETYWIRFRVHNRGAQAKRWVLHNDTSYIDHVTVYYRDTHKAAFQQQHLSDRQPFDTRPIEHRYLAFGHTTAAHGFTDVYLKVYFDKADSLSLNFHLWDEAAFWDNAREENLIYGGYYGVLLVLMVISLTVAALLRQVNAFYYALFTLSTAAMWLLLNGYAFQYLWPQAIFWQNEGFHIFYLLFSVLALQFSKSFLRTRTLQPSAHKLLTAFQIIGLTGVALRLAGAYGPVLHLAYGLLLFLALTIPVVSWRAYRRGLNYARWYTVAWLIYSVSLLICVVSAYSGALQWGMSVLNYMQAGSLLEALLLTVAVAEWLISLDTDRKRAIALAHQDPLTGLGNRRLLQMEYENFREQFKKTEQPVFLIMMDLDHFKQINDTYGHEAGDYVLKEVANLIRNLSRDGDVCVRYGGEEFAILLRADDLDAVWQIAERIRLQFSQTPTLYNDSVIEHTLSSGLTQVLSEHEILSVQEMMARADAALYRGKSAGRNRSTIYAADGDDNAGGCCPLSSA